METNNLEGDTVAQSRAEDTLNGEIYGTSPALSTITNRLFPPTRETVPAPAPSYFFPAPGFTAAHIAGRAEVTVEWLRLNAESLRLNQDNEPAVEPVPPLEPIAPVPDMPTKVIKNNALGDKASAYVRSMAQALGVRPDGTELVGAADMTMAEVNRALVKIRREQELAKDSLITDQQLSNLAELGRGRLAEIKASIRAEAATRLSQVEALNLTLQRKLTDYAMQRRKLLAITDTGVDVAGQLRQVLSEGWYTLESVTGKDILLATPDVTLKYTHRGGSINRSVTVGRYAVRVTLFDGMILVRPHQDNGPAQTRDEYYHPHVGSGGQVCWGNAHAAYETLAKDFDMRPSLAALRLILENYNPDSPYTSFNEMVKAAERKEKLKGKTGMFPDIPSLARQIDDDDEDDEHIFADEEQRPAEIYVANIILFKLRVPYNGIQKYLPHLDIYANMGRFFIIGHKLSDGSTYYRLKDGSFIGADAVSGLTAHYSEDETMVAKHMEVAGYRKVEFNNGSTAANMMGALASSASEMMTDHYTLRTLTREDLDYVTQHFKA